VTEPAQSVTSEHLLQALRHLLQCSAQRSRLLAHHAGLKVPELQSLRAVARLPGSRCTVAQVAADAGLSLPTASRIIAGLVDKGYLAREHSTRDRRKVFPVLTERGRHVLASSPLLEQERFVERFERLPPVRRSELVGALGEVAALLEGVAPDQLDPTS